MLTSSALLILILMEINYVTKINNSLTSLDLSTQEYNTLAQSVSRLFNVQYQYHGRHNE